MKPHLSEAEFELFRRLIKEHVGISFSRTKKGALQRKLIARLRQLGLESFRDYYDHLVYGRKGRWELRRLINTITVDQTAFFRHVKQFEHLANIILPQITAQNEKTRQLRIWSAGCSTGEEAYSIAMVVNEVIGEDSSWDIKILASDIDTDALKFAYKGLYPKRCVEEVPSEYLDKYLIEETGGPEGAFAVREELKRNILFRRLNFMDPGFLFRGPVDIIFCRNVMIYFDQEIKKRLIDNFFRVMAEGGFLCLGASESLVGMDSRFVLVGHAIYQKQGKA